MGRACLVCATPAPVRGHRSEVTGQEWSQQVREERLGMEEQSVCDARIQAQTVPQRLSLSSREAPRGDREGSVREEEKAGRRM